MQRGKAENIISGIGWSFGERILAQGITFIVSIVIARILSPDEYGIIALVLVFINLANVFVANGFGESLIQKKDATKEDFSTIFWCTFVFSILLYVLLFILSPLISKFYKNEGLIVLLRVLALKIPLSSINTIQHAYVSRNMQFRKFFFSTLGGTIISGIVGIALAYTGCGVWALVAQYLVNSTIDTIVLLFTVNWHPEFIFNKNNAKIMLKYAWKITGAAFINELYGQVRSLIIGKLYSPADLAYYNKGEQFPSLIITNISVSISKVFFPVMSNLQNDVKELKELTRKTIKILSFVIFPLLIGLMGISQSLIIVLLTDKWLPTVPFLQILCVYFITQPLQSVHWQVLKAIGRSDLCLKLEILKKVIGFVLIFSTMFIGVDALAWSTAVFAIISMVINMIPNIKIINYSIKEQLKDISTNLIVSIIMGVIVLLLGKIQINSIVVLLLQLLFGFGSYIVMSFLLKNESLKLIHEYIKRFIKDKKIK